ncbi:hypothetical protein EMMF5_000708 [Cystobasidiomycetes sp. EMM_F5]
MSQQSASAASPIQGIFQVSVVGQLPASLLEQTVRRLRSYAQHECQYTLVEDVLTRAHQDVGQSVRDDDILRVRDLTIKDETIWSLDSLTRPVPVRENGDVLIRGLASTPVIEGNASALAVALGYSDRRATFKRKGHLFTSAGGLTKVQIYRLYHPTDDPLDDNFYLAEVSSTTSHKPGSTSGSAPMQVLRDNAIQRTMEVKGLLKGLVDLARVE